MSEIKFTNGATVSRIWTDSECELLGAFQYSTDAERFAGAKLAEDVANNWHNQSYVVCDLYSGKAKIIRHKSEKSA